MVEIASTTLKIAGACAICRTVGHSAAECPEFGQTDIFVPKHQLTLGEWAEDPRNCWGTPPEFFVGCNEQGKFDIDLCALDFNTKLPTFWSPKDNSLAQSWRGKRGWCNCPYDVIPTWVEKCCALEAAVVALLVPVRSDLEWWRRACQRATFLDFVEGRIQMVPAPGIKASTPFERSAVFWFFEGVLRSPQVRHRSSKDGRLIYG